MKYEVFDYVLLKDGRKATIVDILGEDYVIDIGHSTKDWTTELVKEEDIKSLTGWE